MALRKRRVRLHLADGPPVEGVMVARPRSRSGYFALSDSAVVTSPGETTATGHVEVPRERVLFYQELR